MWREGLGADVIEHRWQIGGGHMPYLGCHCARQSGMCPSIPLPARTSSRGES